VATATRSGASRPGRDASRYIPRLRCSSAPLVARGVEGSATDAGLDCLRHAQDPAILAENVQRLFESLCHPRDIVNAEITLVLPTRSAERGDLAHQCVSVRSSDQYASSDLLSSRCGPMRGKPRELGDGSHEFSCYSFSPLTAGQVGKIANRIMKRDRDYDEAWFQPSTLASSHALTGLAPPATPRLE